MRVLINKRSKFRGIENGFRAVSTRTSCYRIRSEQTTEERKDAPPGQAASGSTDWSDKAVAMAFGLAGAAKRSTDPLGPEWRAWETASCNKPNAIFDAWLL
jgi:hypothetical protein